jgi:hypothetical protein
VDSLTAGFMPPAVPPSAPAAAGEQSDEERTSEAPVADEAAADTTTDASTHEAAPESSDAESGVTAEEEANSINARHAGWQYRVPDYKANLLARRWADILKADE